MERPEEALASLHQRCNGFSSPAFTPECARETTAYIEHLEKKVADAPFEIPGYAVTNRHEYWNGHAWERPDFEVSGFPNGAYIVRKRQPSAAERVLGEVIAAAPPFFGPRQAQALVENILAKGTYVPNESQQ